MAEMVCLEEQFISGYATANNCGEVFLSPLELFVIIDVKSSVNVLYRTIEKFGTACSLFCDVLYTSEIIIICGNFCSLDQHNNKFPFVIAHTTRHHSHRSI